MPSTS